MKAMSALGLAVLHLGVLSFFVPIRSTFPFVPEAADYLKQHSPETDGVVVGTHLWASGEVLTPKALTDKAIGTFAETNQHPRDRPIATPIS